MRLVAPGVASCILTRAPESSRTCRMLEPPRPMIEPEAAAGTATVTVTTSLPSSPTSGAASAARPTPRSAVTVSRPREAGAQPAFCTPSGVVGTAGVGAAALRAPSLAGLARRRVEISWRAARAAGSVPTIWTSSSPCKASDHGTCSGGSTRICALVSSRICWMIAPRLPRRQPICDAGTSSRVVVRCVLSLARPPSPVRASLAAPAPAPRAASLAPSPSWSSSSSSSSPCMSRV
mmetsp:Transcript_8788/g.35916  ORF Transcript_8788/g.35916 Transcript_8788/m.35916 type:complete len:235 (-) Transcript_8788:1917-2621(-)